MVCLNVCVSVCGCICLHSSPLDVSVSVHVLVSFLYIFSVTPLCFVFSYMCVSVWLHTLSCVFTCWRISKHEFQFLDTVSVPFNPYTFKKEKRRKYRARLKPSTQHNTTNQTVKWNSHHHRKETSKYPKSHRKT